MPLSLLLTLYPLEKTLILNIFYVEAFRSKTKKTLAKLNHQMKDAKRVTKIIETFPSDIRRKIPNNFKNNKKYKKIYRIS